MKTQFLNPKSLILAAAFLSASGCFNADMQAQPNSPDPRDALVSALDSHMTRLIGGINQVIIQGSFIQQLALQNPPQPIPMQSDDDVDKGINYLLSNESASNGVVTYTPDPRFCTEIVAVNDPASCVQVMTQTRLVQTDLGNGTGTLQIQVGGADPLLLSYGPSEIDATVDGAEFLKTLQFVNQVQAQNGEQGLDGLPSSVAGKLRASLANVGDTAVSVTLNIDQAVDIEGQDSQGHSFQLKLPATQNLASVTLDPTAAIGTVSINLPAFDLHAPLTDSQNVEHDAVLSFPGASGSLRLDNSAIQLAAQAVKLASPNVTFAVDGNTLVQATLTGELDASASPNAGSMTLSFANGISAQAQITGMTNVIDGNGTVSAAIVQGTQILVPAGGAPAEVLAGSFQLSGTGDLAGTLDAEPSSCFEGNSGSGLFLVAAACQ